ncbi:MAG: exonuclease subunit SbcD [Clostridia bacterium]|nr:exonuclease subunit SbcD [Clostridia bacterium]
MRILHTSDLHIGKRIGQDRERSEEYRAVFDELASVCEKEDIELVLIAGDVYDTFMPSAESESIFYDGVKKLAQSAAVLVISGNHDDPARLTAAASLAEEQNVYITGNSFVPARCAKRGRTYPAASGKGWVIMQTDPTPEHPEGERVYVNLLPYPNEARINEEKTDETYQEKIDRWIAEGNAGNTEGLPSVLLAHILVMGGIRTSISEREIDIGGARQVDPKSIAGFGYCALGHIHKHMKVAPNAWYCGAPMQFAFDEAGSGKYANVLDLTAEGVKDFKEVELHAGVRLARLEAFSMEDALEILEKNRDCYVELTLNLTAPISRDETRALHAGAKYVSIIQTIETKSQDREYNTKGMSSSELFKTFYKKGHDNQEPRAELLELFLSLTETEEGLS